MPSHVGRGESLQHRGVFDVSRRQWSIDVTCRKPLRYDQQTSLDTSSAQIRVGLVCRRAIPGRLGAKTC